MLMKLVFDSAKKNYDSKVGFTLLPGAGVPEGGNVLRSCPRSLARQSERGTGDKVLLR